MEHTHTTHTSKINIDNTQAHRGPVAGADRPGLRSRGPAQELHQQPQDLQTSG